MSEAEPPVTAARTNDRWRLDGRVALVTGASAGLGARFARVLHAAGAHVIATARRADRLDELAQHCGNRMQTIAGDIADRRDHEEIVAALQLRDADQATTAMRTHLARVSRHLLGTG